MKTLYLLFSLSFCLFFFGCNKEKEPDEPAPKPTKIKYLQKVIMVFGDEENIWEEYAWNDQKQLVQMNFVGPHTYRFTYNKDNNPDSIYYSSFYGKYMAKFYYDESNKIKTMEYKTKYDYSDYEQPYPHRVEYIYKGTDNKKLDYVNFVISIPGYNEHNSLISFEWKNDNISHLSDNVFGKNINYYTYDSSINPYRFFPQVILPYLADDIYWAITNIISSANNHTLINWGGDNIEYKYDYDEDGYPIIQYKKENDQWIVYRKYEYLPE